MFDAVITDPPYSSGGMTISDRIKSTAEKYTTAKKGCKYPDFAGDNKDQRSWTNWMAEWLLLTRQKSKLGAPVCVFTDWRQLPSLTDALQWAGWVWRGVLTWDKKNARPQPGRFRQQTEYIVWGSNGKMDIHRPVPILPGIYSQAMPSENKRLHQTQKPLELMRELVKICEPGGLILDPFCGSGTTLEAAVLDGYSAIGIEASDYYAEIAKERIQKMEGNYVR